MTHNNKIIAWAKETGKKLRISTYDMTGEEGWVPLVYADNDAGAMNKAKNEEQTFGAEMRTIATIDDLAAIVIDHVAMRAQ